MALTITFPSGPQYKYVKRPTDKIAYNKLMHLLRRLGIRSATDHPIAIYIPGIY